jgi:hypothetical protein
LAPIGVAWGAWIRALAGIACMFPITMRWAKEVPIPAALLAREGIWRPLVIATPVLLYLVFMGLRALDRKAERACISSRIGIAFAVVWSKLLRHRGSGPMRQIDPCPDLRLQS